MIKFTPFIRVLFVSAMVILIWQLLAVSGLIGATVLASPVEVAGVLWRSLHTDQAVYVSLWSTALRALIGWSAAVFVGLATGALLGSSRTAMTIVEPFVEFCRAVPPVLFFPAMLVVFNFTDSAHIFTVFLGCLPVMILTVSKGVRGRNLGRAELVRVHVLGWLKRCGIAMMEVLPSAFLGGRIIFSFSLIIAVVTEMVFAPRSRFAIGSLAKDSEMAFDTPTFFACILLIGVYASLCNIALRLAERTLGGTRDGLADS